MAKPLFSNNAASTLASGISDSATTIAVATGEGALFDSPTGGDWMYLTIVDSSGTMEIVKCTARTTDSLTVVRAQQGTGTTPNTTGYAFAAGALIEQRITAQDLEDVLDVTHPVASQTTQGIVELATITEVRTGTDTARAVTPAGVAGAIGNTIQGYDADTLKADVSDVLTKGFLQSAVTITDAATPTIDLTASNHFLWVLGADRTFPELSPTAAGRWLFQVSGDYTLTYDAAYDVYGDAYDGSGTNANVIMFVYDGTNKMLFVRSIAEAA